MTIVCQIPSSLTVYNITWTRNETVLNITAEGFEVIEYNLLTIRAMDVPSNEYKCMVYKNISDQYPIISSPLLIYKYSKYLRYRNSCFLKTLEKWELLGHYPIAKFLLQTDVKTIIVFVWTHHQTICM